MPKDTKLYDLLNVGPDAGENEIRKVNLIFNDILKQILCSN